MRVDSIKSVCTCLGVGYFPAPGTCASALTCVVVWFCGGVSVGAAVFVTIVALMSVRRYLSDFSHVCVDPPHIVIDEVAGQICSFIGVPITAIALFVGFALFRVLDIMKPGVIKKAERLHGAYGVVCDDVLAGLFTMVALRIGSAYGFV